MTSPIFRKRWTQKLWSPLSHLHDFKIRVKLSHRFGSSNHKPRGYIFTRNIGGSFPFWNWLYGTTTYMVMRTQLETFKVPFSCYTPGPHQHFSSKQHHITRLLQFYKPLLNLNLTHSYEKIFAVLVRRRLHCASKQTSTHISNFRLETVQPPPRITMKPPPTPPLPLPIPPPSPQLAIAITLPRNH